MKNVICFLTILLFIASCSKTPEDRSLSGNYDLPKDNISNKLSTYPCIDTLILSEYLIKHPLSENEIDSLKKVTTINGGTEKSSSVTTTEGEYPEYTDYSGMIHFKVFYAYNSVKVQHPVLIRSVPDNYAMIGGGAYAYGYSGNGAFLTASRPLNSTTWQGQSKDHIVPDPHNLKVFAIGMRIDGVDPAYLKSKIHIVSNTSAFSDFPNVTATIPEDCLLIGGGALDNYYGYGNMLVASYPNYIYWQAGGKAYRRSDPSQITAYAIGIEDISYPTVGYLQLTVRQITESAYGDIQYCYAPVWSGFALTCPGGYCTFNSFGRMLVGLYPQDLFPGSQVISKDTPSYGDYGSNSSFATGIQKRPY